MRETARVLTGGGARFMFHLLILFLALTALTLATARDARRVSADHSEIYLAESPDSPAAVGTLFFAPNGPPVTLYALARNVTHEPTGVAAFEVDLRFDGDVVSVTSMEADATWLGLTGRAVSCPPPVIEQLGSGEWRADVSCSTFAASPPGPNGGGLLATIVVEPGPTFGSTVLDNQSFLLNTTGDAEVIPVGLPDAIVIISRCGDVAPPGGNGVVNGPDIASIVLRFGETSEDPGWIPTFDLNGDGRVNGIDIALVVLQFGGSCAS